MFRYILTSFVFAMSLIARGQEISFTDTKLSFGFVHEGDIVNLNYEFMNTGDQPLVISDYKVECSCTVMEKPSAPILPGQRSALKVTFDTHNKYDRQDRTVTVISNAKNSPSNLRFKGVVLKPKKKE
jgi:hypothetical protein